MTMVWSPDYAPVDGDFDSVSLLLKGEGADTSTTILDSSKNNLSVSVVGDAQISTAVATPFSPTVPSDGVLAFDGTGDYLTVPGDEGFNMLNTDITFETWFKLNSTSSSNTSLFSVGGSTGYYQLLVNGPSINLNSSPNGTTFYQFEALQTFDTNWHHIALTKSGSTYRIFYDGININATGTVTNNIQNNELFIAENFAGGGPLNGYLSNFRITKGVARYTENFDVPTAPFPIYSPTTRTQA